jgi:ceramide glucosyltransferase
MSALWVPIVYEHYLDRYPALIAAGAGLVLALALDAVRLSSGRVNDWFFRHLHFLIREDERKTLNTSTLFILSIFLSALFFEKRVAVMALQFLALGDPIAALIGTSFGRHRIFGKSLEGSAACFLTCFVIAQMQFPVSIALWAALCATIFELISTHINDNIAIPLFSGLAVTLLLEDARIYRPLRYAFIVFQVYLLFVVLTALAGILIRHFSRWRYQRDYRERHAEPATPGVSIIKPILGLTERSRELFSRFCTQGYAGEYELIFVVDEDQQDALALIEELRREHPAVAIHVTRPAAGPGHERLRKLRAGVALARHEILIFSDDRVAPGPRHVERLVRPFADPEVALVTAAPFGAGARTPPEAIGALVTTYLSMAIYYPLAYLEKLDTALGATLAVRRSVLQEIGDLDALASQMAEDHALAREVVRRGYRVVLTDRPVCIDYRGLGFRSFLRQSHRRAVLLRTYAPQAYPLFILQTGIFHAVILSLVRPGAATLLLLALITLSECLSMAAAYSSAGDHRMIRHVWLTPFWKLLGPLFWISGLLSNVVSWHGKRYFVDRDGTLTPIRPLPAAPAREAPAARPLSAADFSGFMGGDGRVHHDEQGRYLGHAAPGRGLPYQGFDRTLLPADHWLLQHPGSHGSHPPGFQDCTDPAEPPVQITLPHPAPGEDQSEPPPFCFRVRIPPAARTEAARFRIRWPEPAAETLAALAPHYRPVYRLADPLGRQRSPWRRLPEAHWLDQRTLEAAVTELPPPEHGPLELEVAHAPRYPDEALPALLQRCHETSRKAGFHAEIRRLGFGGLASESLPPADQELNPILALILQGARRSRGKPLLHVFLTASRPGEAVAHLLQGLIAELLERPRRYLEWARFCIVPLPNPDGWAWNLPDQHPLTRTPAREWYHPDCRATEARSLRQAALEFCSPPERAMIIDLEGRWAHRNDRQPPEPHPVFGIYAATDHGARENLRRFAQHLAPANTSTHTAGVQPFDHWIQDHHLRRLPQEIPAHLILRLAYPEVATFETSANPGDPPGIRLIDDPETWNTMGRRLAQAIHQSFTLSNPAP